MGRLGTCGWELLSTSDGGFWDTASGGTVSAAASRTGDRGLRFNASFTFVAKQFKPNGTTDDYFARVPTRINTSVTPTSPATRTQWIAVQDSGTGQNVFTIQLNPDDTLELWKGGGSPAQIGSDSAALSGYQTIGLEYDQSTATVTAYIDGVSFASGTVDASHDNASTIIIGLFGNIDAGEVDTDDFAHNDQSGSVENTLPDWRGKCYVSMPDAAGDNADGTRGGADSGSDFGQVDERPPNDATDYYILDVNGDILDLTWTTAGGALPAGATVNVVQVGIRHRSESAAQMSYQVHIKSQSAGTTLSSATQTHNDVNWLTNGDDTPRNYLLASYVDPQGSGPWTAALLDGLHAGVTAIDAAPDVWTTTLWVYVDYTEAGGFQPAWARGHNELLVFGGSLVR